jgi:hypothetical protein
VADWDVNLAAVEADREVLHRRLRKAQLLHLFGILERRMPPGAKAVSPFFGRSCFLLLGGWRIVSSPVRG